MISIGDRSFKLSKMTFGRTIKHAHFLSLCPCVVYYAVCSGCFGSKVNPSSSLLFYGRRLDSIQLISMFNSINLGLISVLVPLHFWWTTYILHNIPLLIFFWLLTINNLKVISYNLSSASNSCNSIYWFEMWKYMHIINLISY
jgi:hypothetical protein